RVLVVHVTAADEEGDVIAHRDVADELSGEVHGREFRGRELIGCRGPASAGLDLDAADQEEAKPCSRPDLVLDPVALTEKVLAGKQSELDGAPSLRAGHWRDARREQAGKNQATKFHHRLHLEG